MNSQFRAALAQICAEKNIDPDIVMEAVKSAIATAYRKDYGNKDQEIKVEMQDGIDSASILLIKEVVETVENENFEISLAEAKKIKPAVEVGDEIEIDVTPVEYGRIAAQAAKQVMMQRMNEEERKALFTRFKDREGQLLTAMVESVEGSHVRVNVEKSTVILPLRQQIKNERYFPGKRMRVYLEKVAQTTKGPQLQISRTHPELVSQLMQEEIPEIKHEEVEIMAIARDPGFRSKVAVRSEDSKVDPVGACIGQKGTRISPIMEELSGERVDVLEWNENPSVVITRALQPAEIANVIIVNANAYRDEETGKLIKKRAAVFVDEAQRAMAIGKKGQNIRLAGDLTGYELDMYNAEEFEPFKAKLAELMQDAPKPAEVESEPKDAESDGEDS